MSADLLSPSPGGEGRGEGELSLQLNPDEVEGNLTNQSKRLSITRRSEAGFTLAEVLAALLFMAIVIPAAIEGLHIANLAGEVGQRKAVAARVGERVLNELRVTGQWPNGGQRGVIQEGQQQYRWTGTLQPWTEDAMQVATVEVAFPVQGRDYDLSLSTLVNNTLP